MNLREQIRRALREQTELPISIRRRIKMGENDIINYLRKFAIRTFQYDEKIEKIVGKACRNTAYEILDSTHTSIDNDTFSKLEDELTIFLKNKYGEQIKDFIQNFYNESGDDNGTVYIFRKHEEKNGNNGGRGFSQSFSTWNGLLKEYADWFPSLDWADIKETLDSMPDKKQLLIVEPGDKINTMGYYFSLVKIKRNENLNESTDDKYAVIEITKPSSRMPSKWYFQAVPLNKTKEDKIYIKRGSAGTLTISTKNIKIHKTFKNSEKEEMDKYLEKLRDEDTKKGINESVNHWLRRRFDIDELNHLVKDIKDQIEEGESLDTAIYDTIRQFIATKEFNDINNNAPEREYWDSYLRYEEPLVKYVKEKLESKKGEMKEGELTEKCWKGYTQKGMKTMFGKRYPNCVKKTK